MSNLVDLKFNPDERTLRQFGILAFGFFSALGILAYFGWIAKDWTPDVRVRLAVLAGIIGVLSGLLSIFRARWNRPLYVAMSLVAYPIGTVVSFVVLAVVFFLVVGPLAIGLRLAGRDTLDLRGVARPSYWRKADQQKSDSSYFQQF